MFLCCGNSAVSASMNEAGASIILTFAYSLGIKCTNSRLTYRHILIPVLAIS